MPNTESGNKKTKNAEKISSSVVAQFCAYDKLLYSSMSPFGTIKVKYGAVFGVLENYIE